MLSCRTGPLRVGRAFARFLRLRGVLPLVAADFLAERVGLEQWFAPAGAVRGWARLGLHGE